MPERGKHIVFEGSDEAGKLTQAKMLEAMLRAGGADTRRVVNGKTGGLELVREPGSTILQKDGFALRTPSEELELVTEARASVWRGVIEPALDRGLHVVTTNNWLSTLANQRYAEDGPSAKEIENYTRERVGEAYMYPNFVAILALTQAAARRASESKPNATQYSMNDAYVQIAKDRHLPIIDAGGSRYEVFGRVVTAMAPVLDDSPLQ